MSIEDLAPKILTSTKPIGNQCKQNVCNPKKKKTFTRSLPIHERIYLFKHNTRCDSMLNRMNDLKREHECVSFTVVFVH